MEQKKAVGHEPTASAKAQAFAPSHAFGYDTARYCVFIEALADGLREYESRRQRGVHHAQVPLPAA